MSVVFAAEELAAWSGGRWLTSPRAAATGFGTDTRALRDGDVFVAVRTGRRDGHDFLAAARAQGAAGESGIRRGDLILGVNGKRTRSLKEFRDAVSQAGKVVALLVQRGDQQVFIPVRPG